MKVAVLHNLTAGGAHRRLGEQVSRMENVFEITTATAEPVTMRPVVVPLRPLARSVLPVLRPPLRYRDLREVRSAWRRMGQLAEASGADVVFANPDRFLTGAVDCATWSIPVVRYCDEPRRIDYEPELAATRNSGTRLLYRDLHRREAEVDRQGVRRATTVLTNSEYTARRIRLAYGVPAQVVPSGVPPVMTPGLPAGPRHLLSVGSLMPSKGHGLVIEAAARSGLELPVVVVAHRHQEAEEARLHALATRHGVDLRFDIGITDEELAEHYRSAFALLYLAEREPLGLASLEAQACGCPVIVADEGGLPETLAPGGRGFVVPRDAAAAARALQTLAGDPVPRAAGGLDLRAPGWDHSVQTLMRHLADALGGGRASAPSVVELAGPTPARVPTEEPPAPGLVH